MKRSAKKTSSGGKMFGILFALLAVIVIVVGFLFFNPFGGKASNTAKKTNGSSTSASSQTVKYEPSQEEKDYLKNRFDQLIAVNPEAIAYVYAPGTELDEPVVQTTDNETYLNKTFDGGNVPYLGTVFMDMDNKKDFSDRLTWLFGHARGSKVGDHRMFNDVNYYDKQEYLDQHPYVVIETPERKYFYCPFYTSPSPRD